MDTIARTQRYLEPVCRPDGIYKASSYLAKFAMISGVGLVGADLILKQHRFLTSGIALGTVGLVADNFLLRQRLGWVQEAAAVLNEEFPDVPETKKRFT